MAYQAGFVLRLFDLPPHDRFDFAGTGLGPAHVETLLTTGQPLSDASRAGLPQFAEMIVQWAMLNLRSYAIGLRIDQWLATEYPSLRADQAEGMDAMQQENLALLTKRFSGLSVPVSLLAPVSAYALFADRLLGKSV